MTRRIVRLTPDRLTALGATVPCGTCVFWELDPVRRSRLASERSAEERAVEEKHLWLSEVLREWGSCGRVALVDDQPAGYVIYAPASYVPGSAGFATAPVSSDAVLLTALHVRPAARGRGLGRQLVQAMAADLVGRSEHRTPRAVEAFAASGGSDGCRTPEAFLSRVGFRTQRPHPTTPRMRMELRTTVTWRDEVEAAVDRLLGAVRPGPVPEQSQSQLRALRHGGPIRR